MPQNGRITPGQKLGSAVSARAWNRAQDAADIVLESRGNLLAGDSRTIERAPNVVLVYNYSGYPVPIGGALRVSGVFVNPADGDIETDEPQGADLDAREFVRRPVLYGSRPASPADQIVVALEPVGTGDVGRFAAGGVFPVKVRRLSLGHRYAAARKDDVTQLVSASCGPVELLYAGGPLASNNEEPETTAYWSLGKM